MKVDFSLLQLLSSRLAHDLVGPVGSLGFAIDIIKEEANLDNQEAISLASTSAQNLVNRLSFFRMALGFAKLGQGERGFLEAKELLLNLFKEKNIKVTWEGDSEKLLLLAADNDNIKLIINTFLIIYYATSKSAKVTVFVKEVKDKVGVALLADGTNLRLSSDNLQSLRMEVEEKDLTARNIHSYFTALLAKKVNANLEISNDTTENIQIAYLLNKIRFNNNLL
ncbi:Protein phosphotransferase ChpT [Candidatus Hepatincola sp. Av]